MLSCLFGIDRLARLINRNHGATMSALDNLKREVAETTASNKVLIEALNNLRSDVEGVKAQLAAAIEAETNSSELQGLADTLDAAQTSAREALEQNKVPNPGDPVPAVDPVPGNPPPLDTGGATQTEDQPAGTGGQPAQGGATADAGTGTVAPTDGGTTQPTQTEDQAAGTGGQPAQGGATADAGSTAAPPPGPPGANPGTVVTNDPNAPSDAGPTPTPGEPSTNGTDGGTTVDTAAADPAAEAARRGKTRLV